MEITVTGVRRFRDFTFPGDFFKSNTRFTFGWVERNLKGNTMGSSDLSDTAYKLAREIILLGEIREVDFKQSKAQMTVWTTGKDFDSKLVSQIKDLIYKYYGPDSEPAKVIYLPFGWRLLPPR